MDLRNGTVQRHGFDLHPNALHLLQLGKDPIQRAALRPPVHACIDRALIPKLLREAEPFAAMLGDIQDCVEHL
jgi:hypothetical protein